MTGDTLARIILAAVQARSLPRRVTANPERAEPMVEQGAAQGARPVMLPELFSCAHVPNRTVWDRADPRDGPTG